jgi:hypothetical protein
MIYLTYNPIPKDGHQFPSNNLVASTMKTLFNDTTEITASDNQHLQCMPNMMTTQNMITLNTVGPGRNASILGAGLGATANNAS